MGGGDHCAVFGCNNDRRYPKRYIIKDHVTTLRFHSCRNNKLFPVWTRLIHRQGVQVKASTTVCSNHFKYGQPFPDDLHPSLFLKGYDTQKISKRAAVKRRALDVSTPQPKKKARTSKYISIGVQANPDIDSAAFDNDHNYTHTPLRNKQFSPEYVAHVEEELAKVKDSGESLKQKFHDTKMMFLANSLIWIGSPSFGVRPHACCRLVHDLFLPSSTASTTANSRPQMCLQVPCMLHEYKKNYRKP